MKTVVLSLAFAGLLLASVQAKVEEKKPADTKTAVNLLGDYTIVSGENDGQKVPDELIVGTLVHVTEDRILMEDKDHKSTPYIATYEVDTSKKPWSITMTSMLAPTKGETVKGLIEKDGEQLRLIYALPGGTMPKEFKTQEKQLLFVMKPVSK
jgi:uncharacterized protein (TIGR03067 family)